MAKPRVNKALLNLSIFKSKKPSITYYPAKVPVIVLDYPLAKSPTLKKNIKKKKFQKINLKREKQSVIFKKKFYLLFKI
jgi:hypothetical protein